MGRIIALAVETGQHTFAADPSYFTKQLPCRCFGSSSQREPMSGWLNEMGQFRVGKGL